MTNRAIVEYWRILDPIIVPSLSAERVAIRSSRLSREIGRKGRGVLRSPLVKSAQGTFIPQSRFPHPTETPFMLTTAHIQPLAALLGGILILLVPRLLNYIVAIYLILVGIMGLGLRFH
jgi:DUF3096 family protein